jgi:putative Holliday junction resolvase
VGRILALDLGEKRIGVAISDPTKTIAQPLKTIPFKTIKELILDLAELLNEHVIERIVVGFPLTLKGTFSAKTKETKQVFDELSGALSTPMELFDERLTTAMAHETLRQLDRKPSRERDRVDQLAAMHMLQIYLDRAANLMRSRKND